MNEGFFVYILASRRNGTLYVGVTNDLSRRMTEHKAKLVSGFARKYGVDKLVHARLRRFWKTAHMSARSSDGGAVGSSS